MDWPHLGHFILLQPSSLKNLAAKDLTPREISNFSVVTKIIVEKIDIDLTCSCTLHTV